MHSLLSVSPISLQPCKHSLKTKRLYEKWVCNGENVSYVFSQSPPPFDSAFANFNAQYPQ